MAGPFVCRVTVVSLCGEMGGERTWPKSVGDVFKSEDIGLLGGEVQGRVERSDYSKNLS